MKTLEITEPILVLIGPTAIGKTALSLEMAERFGCEIISVDSMQVYRFMDIGTAKATPEERARVPHHLIDIVDPDEQYDAARFVADALAAIARITSKGRIPLLTGGTGLYLAALCHGLFTGPAIDPQIRERLRWRLREEGREALHRELCMLDPESGARIHVNDFQRILRGLEIVQSTGLPWSEHLRRQSGQAAPVRFTRMLQLGLNCERDLLYERIRLRSLYIMQEPFLQEVRDLLQRGYDAALPSMQSIGYRHACNHLAGLWSLEEATEYLIRDTRRYGKRQLTWFRRLDAVTWCDISRSEIVLEETARFLDAPSSGGSPG
ncbi:MAG: tRNA (adenosine(37)-N6)-dimethylallyltransferase MiaA [Desulfobulbus sp.]|jgi:tRNA dimethylallyltransferase